MKHILITGGAGFIGVNTAAHYLAKGDKVTIFDNFSRRGTKTNAAWLNKTFPKVEIITGDVRDEHTVEHVAKGREVIFHFAGQVAVTGSVHNPREDFDTNAFGTFNLLEAVRTSGEKPIIVYSSTNKVYGALEQAHIREEATRYAFVDRPEGIDEMEPLDFHSPYGCSKGAADQYVHDYSRMYDIPTIVFRQSCIYGPHQLGVEDQGWVAWFIIAALRNKPITIYGNGKQVRDILWVEDLMRAYDMSIESIAKTNGQIYNMGGGAGNTISIWKEFEPIIEKLIAKKLHVSYKPERPGDQPIFVANTAKALRDFGWKPTVGVQKGLRLLYTFLEENIPEE
jgi:CDP-paratose 2-epimerase